MAGRLTSGFSPTHDDLDLSASHTAIHSEQRYSMPGGRWTTIWTSLPLLEVLETADPGRCVAVRLDAGDAGELVVYGTVLPWNGDTGPDATSARTRLGRVPRVVPGQGREWASLREHHPEATIIVAGDLNQDLGGRHYYGTRKCRALLNAELAKPQLTCLTTTDRFDPGILQHPPIDHICAGSGRDSSFTNDVYGWNKDVNGIELSDHGGTLANLEIKSGSTGASPTYQTTDRLAPTSIRRLRHTGSPLLSTGGVEGSVVLALPAW